MQQQKNKKRNTALFLGGESGFFSEELDLEQEMMSALLEARMLDATAGSLILGWMQLIVKAHQIVMEVWEKFNLT